MPRKKTYKRTPVSETPPGDYVALTIPSPAEPVKNELFPNVFVEAYKQVPDKFKGLEEEEIYAQVFSNFSGRVPTKIEALRFNFWQEYDKAFATQEPMDLEKVYRGVCLPEELNKYMRFSTVVAYILTQPPSYETVMSSMLNLSTRKLRDILSIPIKLPGGKFQEPKVLDVILKAIGMVDMRMKGGYLQRSETKNLTLQHTKISGSVDHIYGGEGKGQIPSNRTAAQIASDIEDQLVKLQEEEKKLLPSQPSIVSETVVESTVVVDGDY